MTRTRRLRLAAALALAALLAAGLVAWSRWGEIVWLEQLAAWCF